MEQWIIVSPENLRKIGAIHPNRSSEIFIGLPSNAVSRSPILHSNMLLMLMIVMLSRFVASMFVNAPLNLGEKPILPPIRTNATHAIYYYDGVFRYEALNKNIQSITSTTTTKMTRETTTNASPMRRIFRVESSNEVVQPSVGSSESAYDNDSDNQITEPSDSPELIDTITDEQLESLPFNADSTFYEQQSPTSSVSSDQQTMTQPQLINTISVTVTSPTTRTSQKTSFMTTSYSTLMNNHVKLFTDRTTDKTKVAEKTEEIDLVTTAKIQQERSNKDVNDHNSEESSDENLSYEKTTTPSNRFTVRIKANDGFTTEIFRNEQRKRPLEYDDDDDDDDESDSSDNPFNATISEHEDYMLDETPIFDESSLTVFSAENTLVGINESSSYASVRLPLMNISASSTSKKPNLDTVNRPQFDATKEQLLTIDSANMPAEHSMNNTSNFISEMVPGITTSVSTMYSDFVEDYLLINDTRRKQNYAIIPSSTVIPEMHSEITEQPITDTSIGESEEFFDAEEVMTNSSITLNDGERFNGRNTNLSMVNNDSRISLW